MVLPSASKPQHTGWLVSLKRRNFQDQNIWLHWKLWSLGFLCAVFLFISTIAVGSWPNKLERKEFCISQYLFHSAFLWQMMWVLAPFRTHQTSHTARNKFFQVLFYCESTFSISRLRWRKTTTGKRIFESSTQPVWDAGASPRKTSLRPLKNFSSQENLKPSFNLKEARSKPLRHSQSSSLQTNLSDLMIKILRVKELND